MILCNIHQADRFRGTIPYLDEILEFMLYYNPDEFEDGSRDLGHGITVKAESTGLLPREKVLLEAHRDFIDIHMPITGSETIGWARTGDLSLIHKAYDEERDVAFYGDLAQCMLHVKPGQIAVFFPEDAHAPNIGIGTHRKLCIKIPVIY